MTSKSNFLEANPEILEKNLRFVKNEVEDELEQIFGQGSSSGGSSGESQVPLDYKIVKPKPGMCIKCFKVNTHEKFFINLCQTDGILPPQDISETELHEILRSEKPSQYRVPMSISEPRLTKDKSGNDVHVCDIAVNPEFFKKCERILLFRDFLIAIMLEAIQDKFKVELSPDNWIILKNRRLMGTLISHRIQNRDIKRVYDSYRNPSEKDKKLMRQIISSDSDGNNEKKSSKGNNRNIKSNSGDGAGKKKLIVELTPKEAEALLSKNSKQKQLSNSSSDEYASSIPQYRLYKRANNPKAQEVIGEFYLPECVSIKDITLDVGEDRIVLESLKYGYSFDKFINYSIDREKVKAEFNHSKRILQVKMPLIEAGGN